MQHNLHVEWSELDKWVSEGRKQRIRVVAIFLPIEKWSEKRQSLYFVFRLLGEKQTGRRRKTEWKIKTIQFTRMSLTK